MKKLNIRNILDNRIFALWWRWSLLLTIIQLFLFGLFTSWEYGHIDTGFRISRIPMLDLIYVPSILLTLFFGTLKFIKKFSFSDMKSEIYFTISIILVIANFFGMVMYLFVGSIYSFFWIIGTLLISAIVWIVVIAIIKMDKFYEKESSKKRLNKIKNFFIAKDKEIKSFLKAEDKI